VPKCCDCLGDFEADEVTEDYGDIVCFHCDGIRNDFAREDTEDDFYLSEEELNAEDARDSYPESDLWD